MSRPRRERRRVVAVEAVGPYALVRLERGGIDPGRPGQFFMLEAPGRVLPRPMSLCLRSARRAGVPARPGRARDTRARNARAGRRDPRARAARQRLPARRAAPAARRRRHRDRAAAVSLGGARAPAGRARLPVRAPRRGRCARPERRGRDRPGARDRRAARPTATCSRAVRSRCSKRCVHSHRMRNSRGRLRWRAGTARVTAASSRSTAS